MRLVDYVQEHTERDPVAYVLTQWDYNFLVAIGQKESVDGWIAEGIITIQPAVRM
ncbi:MAG TPA: hypothetical protein VD932_02220 [Aquabacterium sp.]|nr:hypothetical protein [Aquabacterium sp.]